MEYIEHLNLFGVEAKEIPCIKGEGSPSETTEGDVGCLYMDTLSETGDIYKCINVDNGVYTWVLLDTDLITNFISPNLLNLEAIETDKYIYTNGELYNNTSYLTTDFIPVKAGDVLRHQFNYNNNRFDNTEKENYCKMEMFAFYDENKTYIENSYAERQTVYTCPEGSKYVRISFNKSKINADGFYNNAIIISDSTEVIPFYPYGLIENKIKSQVLPINDNGNKVIQNSNNGTNISITVPQLKKNKTIGYVGTFETSVSPNLLNLETVEDDKYILQTNGNLSANTSYLTTDFIPVKAGDVIRHQFDYNNTRFDNTEKPNYCNMAMLGFYDENKSYINYAERQTVYTCPEGSKYVRISFNKSHLSGAFSNNAIIISDSADVIPFYPYGTSTPFESLYIYQGKGTGFTECYCVIDDTNLKVYRNGSTTASFEVAHGLTIANYISVVISTTNNNKTIFYINSDGKSFTSAETTWNSSRAEITVEHNITECTNVLTFGSKDFGERVWLYGDSYFDHWLPNLINRGYTAFLDDGFSGASSRYGATSFENALKMGTPSKVVWCLGMNDADTSDVPNINWLKSITTVKNICDLKGIKLIVCTIPNVPERNHNYKNDYIRNNLNYIDIANLVGSDESTSWYSGLLSTDNVHPSTAGDFYIANIMQTYLPELRNS